VSDDPILEASIEVTEHVCLGVWELLAKVQSMLGRVSDMVVPGSTSATIAGIVDALTLKKDGEDPMNIVVCKKVMTSSKSIFTMLLMHGVECDLEKIKTTYPKGKDGHDKSSKEFIEDAQKLANCLALFLVDRNTKRKIDHDAKRTRRGASSNKATGNIS
jgi:hypothetical protein